jgi:alanyl-tRNA synthetase
VHSGSGWRNGRAAARSHASPPGPAMSLTTARTASKASPIAAAPDDIGGVAFAGHRVPDGTAADDVRKLALNVRGRLPAGRAGLAMVVGIPADRPTVVIALNDRARELGLSAGTLVRAAAGQLGGGGGGRDDVAQGGGAPLGGRAAAAIGEAFDAVRAVVRDMSGPGGLA